MARGRRKKQKPERAGNAGLFASFAIAFAGIAIGALAAYSSKHHASAEAARTSAMTAALRDAAALDPAWRARAEIVQSVIEGRPLERLPSPPTFVEPAPRPKIIIIMDDVGIDKRAFERVLALPGPITLSFLPYAKDVNALAARALEEGREIMLHLPMEPVGDADPGPRALRADMVGANFIRELEWNLSRVDGFVGVNNHMGSKLTADEAAMKTILAHLKEQGLFFLDSVTTSDTVARAAGSMVGAQVFSRDVFLDAEAPTADIIKSRLALVERIAIETGYAVAISHPREATLNALGPWLASAPYRGFELVYASALADIEKGAETPPVLAARPGLRS